MRALISSLCRRVRILSDLAGLFRLWSPKGYLRSIGWLESHYVYLPVDRRGQPMPWYTYAATAFLETRTDDSMAVFEYGSGQSTIWWSGHVARVVSCEHDRTWFERFRPRLPDSVEYVLCESISNGEYAGIVQNYHEMFDIVVIDGRDRVKCARNCLTALKPDGVILWDNSERKEYQPGYDYLVGRGFRRLDFHGLGPVKAAGWCTSAFYRKENCLGI